MKKIVQKAGVSSQMSESWQVSIIQSLTIFRCENPTGVSKIPTNGKRNLENTESTMT